MDIVACAIHRTPLCIHCKYNSLHLPTPNSPSIPLPLPWQPWVCSPCPWSVSVYSNFLILNLCPATLLNSLLVVTGFFFFFFFCFVFRVFFFFFFFYGKLLRVFCSMLCKQGQLSFFNLMPFISFYCLTALARTSSTLFSFLLRVLIMKWCWIMWNALSSDEMIIQFLSFILLTWYIKLIDFSYVKPALHLRNKSHLIIDYNYFYVLLKSICQYFIKYFCIHIHHFL